ncbi:hypothetical protein JXA40_03910 [bacterium]|nr:hypothetical protein [candidate division CSSED10-310 bacterium]
MKRMGMILIPGCLVFMTVGAFAAQRVVMYEHFTEDQCLWCADVAVAIDLFRSEYTREQLAVITYSVRGDDPVPGGLDRLDFFGEDAVPVVVGDGRDNLGPMPIDESVLIAHYESRKNEPSILTMTVTKESQTQYRIHVEAESAFTGVLMAVAYEEIIHNEQHYYCWAREILTNYYGDPISLSAGGSTDVIKNVSLQGGWNPGNMGVVAWVHEGSDGGNLLFRAHESLQAADSMAQHTEPTPTPAPTDPGATCTPTPQGTAPPTPTHSVNDLQQNLELSATMFHPDDPFVLDIHTVNPSSQTFNVDQYLALEVAGLFFFWPQWTDAVGYAQRSYPAGCDSRENIFDFTWPSGVGSFSGIHFYLVSLNTATQTLAGPWDMVEWGYTG